MINVLKRPKIIVNDEKKRIENLIRHFVRLDSIVFLPQIQNDQDFIETMINHGRRKRKMTEEHSNRKMRRMTIKNEPEQVSDDEHKLIIFHLASIFSHRSILHPRFSFDIKSNNR